MPSRDVAADLRFFVEVLGGRTVFAIDGMGARVAMLELGEPPPHVLLADHLEGDAPVLVYRVADLDAAMATLRSAAGRAAPGWRSRRGRSARSSTPAAIGWRSTSSPARR